VAALTVVLSGCSLGPWRRQAAPQAGLGPESRQQPALSGDGRLLATLVERAGRSTVLLQERLSGKVLPLRQLRSRQPHSSPSLSWNGRYLALLVQQGARRQAVIEDRATGRLQPLFLPAGEEPQELSLSPDGQRIAVEVISGGSARLRLFDLSGLLEPDPAPGMRQSGGGQGMTP
jgi:Tol biopolymer transport system component